MCSVFTIKLKAKPRWRNITFIKVSLLQLIKYISIVTIIKNIKKPNTGIRIKIRISYNMISIIKELYKN